MRVLLIEDDELDREFVLTVLGHCDVTQAETVAAARSALARGGFGLVLADWELPDGNLGALADDLKASGARDVTWLPKPHRAERLLAAVGVCCND